MDGMEVTATFFDGFTETILWADTGATSGAASGTNWSLSESGDTYGGIWSLSHTRSSGMTGLLIDAGKGDTVYDVGSSASTLGSASGWTFQATGGSANSLNLLATYRDQVALSGDSPVGDLWRFLELDFQNIPLASGATLTYITDTDNIKFAGDIQPIPEPSTLIIWSLLAGIGVAFGWRRRRKAG